MNSFLQSRATIMATVIAVVLFVGSLAGNFDPFDSFIRYLRSLERYQLDEAFLALCIILVGVVWDLLALRNKQLREEDVRDQRMHILKATMVTVMDITNSLLASVRLFLYEVDAGKSVTSNEIAQLDDSMKRSMFRLRSLQGLDSISEIEIDDDSFAIDIAPEMEQT